MKTAKVTRILHSQGRHRAKYARLVAIAARCGRVRAAAWQRCRALTAALGDIRAGREAVQVPVRQALRHRTCGNGGARHRLNARWKRNQWAADACRQRPLRRSPDGPAHVTHPLVLEPGPGRARVQLQGLVRGQRLTLPLRGIHRPTRSLRLLRWDDGQVSRHYALDADVAGGTDILGGALSDSAGAGVGVAPRTSISRHRGAARVWVNVAQRRPHGPPAGPAARSAVVHSLDGVVQALPRGQAPAAGSQRDPGWVGSSRPRAGQAASAALTGRKRIAQPCWSRTCKN